MHMKQDQNPLKPWKKYGDDTQTLSENQDNLKSTRDQLRQFSQLRHKEPETNKTFNGTTLLGILEEENKMGNWEDPNEKVEDILEPTLHIPKGNKECGNKHWEVVK